MSFYIKDNKSLGISLENVEGIVVLKMGSLEVGMFDEKRGLILFDVTTYDLTNTKSLLLDVLDDNGYLLVEKL